MSIVDSNQPSDGMVSLEMHIQLHITDLLSVLAGQSEYQLIDILESLHQLFQTRINGRYHHFGMETMKRLVSVLLSCMRLRAGSDVGIGPSEESNIAFKVFSEFLSQVIEFQEAVENVNFVNLHRAFMLSTRYEISEYKQDVTDVLRTLRTLYPHRYLIWRQNLPLKLISEAESEVVPSMHAVHMDTEMTSHVNWRGTFHDISTDDVSRLFSVDIQRGLDDDDVIRRQLQHGTNTLPSAPSPSPWRILWRQIREPLVLILVIASVISLIIEDYEAAIVIGIVVTVNVSVGFAQEMKAEKIMHDLNKFEIPKATVVRHGETKRVCVLFSWTF